MLTLFRDKSIIIFFVIHIVSLCFPHPARNTMIYKNPSITIRFKFRLPVKYSSRAKDENVYVHCLLQFREARQ